MLCNTGNQTRNRSYGVPGFGGFPGQGSSLDTKVGCNPQTCPCKICLNPTCVLLVVQLYSSVRYKRCFSKYT
jgi:hypothetical protein